MKQTLLAMLLAFTLPAMAQTQTQVTLSPNADAALANSTTNRIFIDQSGDNPNINMTQDGSGNKAGSSQRPIYLRGIGQTISTTQRGPGNEINLEVVNDTTGSGVGATVTIEQVGGSNKVDAACGYGTSSDGSTSLTGCKAAVLNWKFIGNSNELQFRGTGEDLSSSVVVYGYTNKFYIDAIGDKHSQTLTVTGDNNTMTINQRSTGTAGSSVWMDLTGSSNTVNVSQSGSIDNVLNIKTVSNSGTFNIIQKN